MQLTKAQKNPKIAIIVPIYNVEKYLEKCLDSIKCQTYKNFLCICINDGSTDNSKFLVEKYIKKDKRFMLINQENYGVGVTRNIGIKKVLSLKIPYISFVDSDDLISKKYLEFLYKGITNGNYNICESYRVKFRNYYNITFDESKINYHIKRWTYYHYNLSVGIYKSDLFNNIPERQYSLLKGMKNTWGEDTLLSYFIINNNKIRKINIKNRLYAYRVRKSGLTYSYRKTTQDPSFPYWFNFILEDQLGKFDDCLVRKIVVDIIYTIDQSIKKQIKIPVYFRKNAKKYFNKIKLTHLNKINDVKFLLKLKMKFIKYIGVNWYILIKKIYFSINKLFS